MKKIFFILFLIGFKCYSQNLVPNPSFETVDTCYDLGSGFNYGWVQSWDVPSNGSPDAYNTCVITQSSAVPANNFGYQYPHSGNGYGGAGFYSHSGPSGYYQEYIQTKLDTPLVNHQHYCISFYVNHANRYYKLAVRNFGMYISDTHTFNPTTGHLFYTPQIIEPNFVSDDSAWTEVYGQYIAHGGERYIIIGNFNSDSITSDTVHLVSGFPANSYQAYYYIDDVNVHCCTCDSTSSLHNGVGELSNEENVEMHPNPVSTTITIEIKDNKGKVSIYNLLGEIINTTEITNYKTEIDVSTLPKGLYFVEVESEKGIMRKKFVKE
jgi:Secretion system C-terminal sorting domain